MDIMLDIETLGTAPRSVIFAIGAVAFDPDKNEIGNTFYRLIKPESCIAHGMKIDFSTILFWLKQPDDTRLVIIKASEDGDDFISVLQDFTVYLELNKATRVWAKGSNFDCVLVEEACKLAKLPAPWNYRQPTCFRTLTNLYPDIKVPPMPEGQKHNALLDAINQAEHALMIFDCKRKQLEAIA